MLLDLAYLFALNKINWFVLAGTFLGFIREKSFLTHDLDIDIGLMSEDISLEQIKTVLRNLMLGWQLATQKRANMEVAKYLVQAGEYQNFYEAKMELDTKAQKWYEAQKNA